RPAPGTVWRGDRDRLPPARARRDRHRFHRRRLSVEPPMSPSSPPSIEVDAALVARGLGLPLDTFRELMGSGRISTLSERGTDEDSGRYRLSFYYQKRRFRIVTDQAGTVLQLDQRD